MTQTLIIAVNDPNILYLLQRYAEESGFVTVSASRALGGKPPDVLTLLKGQEDPALIILDTGLPGAAAESLWPGLEAAAAARNIPVVVYSYGDDPAFDGSDPARGRHEGAAGRLPNSVMYDDFVAALKSAGVSLEPAFM